VRQRKGSGKASHRNSRGHHAVKQNDLLALVIDDVVAQDMSFRILHKLSLSINLNKYSWVCRHADLCSNRKFHNIFYICSARYIIPLNGLVRVLNVQAVLIIPEVVRLGRKALIGVAPDLASHPFPTLIRPDQRQCFRAQGN
jgi:hypothetical protein